MKKLILIVTLFLGACTPLTPPPFPPRTATPAPQAEPGLPPAADQELRLKPAGEHDLARAGDFLQLLKTRVLAGDSASVAGQVAYPIEIVLDGELVVFHDPAAFEADYGRIFNVIILHAFAAAEPDGLVLTPDGIRVGNGEVWLDLYCLDEACAQEEFRISKLNP